MQKFRIVEKADVSGEICFFPQYNKLWVWFNFYELELFPKLIKFHSLDSARQFLQKQKQAPKIKIHYD